MVSEAKALKLAFDEPPFTRQPLEKQRIPAFMARGYFLVLL
ncbi:MAG: hypothetical protein ABSF95_20830 [Verrucomicrobiota bacterium]|jgi:hypothetical protein